MNSEQKKFLDEDGLKILWNQISMQDYPNNTALTSIINTLNTNKADKTDIPEPSNVYIGEQEPIDENVELWLNPTVETIQPIYPPDTATIGQTIIVKAVDENGNPTEWEAVDLPIGGGTNEFKQITFLEITEEVSSIDISVADDGELITDKCLTEAQVQLYFPNDGRGTKHDVYAILWYPTDSLGAYTLKEAITNSNTWHALDMRAMGVPLCYCFSGAYDPTYKGGAASSFVYTSVGWEDAEQREPYLYHRGFRFTVKDTVFPIGTKVRIYGR